MAQKQAESDAQEKAPKLTMTNTKKEMLAAYRDLVKQLEEKRETEMKPTERIQKRAEEKAVETADALSVEGVGTHISGLKSEIGKVLTGLSDSIEEEVDKYEKAKQAVALKEKELEEIYEIQKQASTLTALLETQKQKREAFEAEMAEQKEELEEEIEATREEWEAEKEAHDEEAKEREAAEKKRRDREAEEYKYKFTREKQIVQEDYEYEKAKLERDMQLKREAMEAELGAREKAVAGREAELNELREKAAAFPEQLEAAVAKAVAEATERLTREAQNSEELMRRESEGEQKVLNSRIDSLRQTVKEQAEHIEQLTTQLTRSYDQVQDIAVKAIEGSSAVKALASIPHTQAAEPPRRQQQGEA